MSTGSWLKISVGVLIGMRRRYSVAAPPRSRTKVAKERGLKRITGLWSRLHVLDALTHPPWHEIHRAPSEIRCGSRSWRWQLDNRDLAHLLTSPSQRVLQRYQVVRDLRAATSQRR